MVEVVRIKGGRVVEQGKMGQMRGEIPPEVFEAAHKLFKPIVAEQSTRRIVRSTTHVPIPTGRGYHGKRR